MTVRLAMTALASAAASWAGLIGPITPSETELVATGGEVVIYFAGETAGLDSVLNMIAPPPGVGPFFPNHATPIGTPLSLGVFAPGTVLSFRLDVLGTGISYFSGPAAGNPDGLVHAGYAGWAADAVIPFAGTLVGFEDLFGGGDLDYDDNTFVLTSVTRTPVVPEPRALIGTAAAGLGMLGALLRRRYTI